jgi:hypothetical protein
MKLALDRRIYERFMAGEALADDDILQLLSLPTETECIEFKGGAELENLPKARRTLRQYATAFANADGGLTIFGISDDKRTPPKRELTDVPTPGGQPLASWATNVLGELAGAFSPLPRIRPMTVQGKNLLLVGVARGPRLIECDGGYHLRFGDSTRKMPAYLINDLVLGRRSHPVLELRLAHYAPPDGRQVGDVRSFEFQITNVGLTPASDIILGIVTWAETSYLPQVASDYLRSFVTLEGQPVARDSGQSMLPVHVQGQGSASLAAFQRTKIETEQIRIKAPDRPVTVRMAVYVVAAGHPPDWYQYDWILQPKEATHSYSHVTRCQFERPVVAWDTHIEGFSRT